MLSLTFFDVAFGSYIIGAATLTLVLLFGESTAMQGTVVERAHAFITGGCWEMLYDVIGSCCGERGQAVYESVFTFVCGIPHPTLQLFYLSLIAFGYLLAVDTVYHQVNAFATAEMLAASSSASWASSLFSLDGCVRAMLALPFSWRVHFYAIPLIVDAGLITFLIVSFSDPGQVHEDNVKHFLDAYPRDGIVYTKQKECSTCRIPRPARSKHCRYCGYCVGRYDHHCGWVNTCIGERNLRYFILFLAINAVMCLYGFVLAASLLAADLDESAALSQRFRATGGGAYTLGDSWISVGRWLLMNLPKKFALALFLFLVTIVAASFTGFQTYLLATNVTTNETFKRLDLLKAELKLNADRRREERCIEIDKNKRDTPYWRRTMIWLRLSSSSSSPPPSEKAIVIPNLYDKGVVSNLLEGFVPMTLLRATKQS